MKVNALGLVGAVIGAVAVFSTWLGGYVLFFGNINWNLLNVLNEFPSDHIAYYSALIFIIGTLVAFLSPAGGVLQVAGVLLWWSYTLHDLGVMPTKMASYLGLTSAIIVLASMARPVGPGLMTGPFDIKSRLLIFSGGKNASSVVLQRAMPFAPGSTNFCPQCGVDVSPGSVRCPKCGRELPSEKK
jgi:hypothetical protein